LRKAHIAIKKLRLDFQPLSGPAEALVAKWVAMFSERKQVDPVRVYFDGEQYHLAQGFDLLAAARRSRRKMVLADVRWGTRSDAETEARSE